MKLRYPEINKIFDTSIGMVNTLIIENQSFFTEFLRDVKNQVEGLDGKSVLSEEDRILKLDKYLDVLDVFVPFELNKKGLISKIVSSLEKEALSNRFYHETMNAIGNLEKFLMNITQNMTCDIHFEKMEIGSIIKASGVTVYEEYDSLGEKVIDYFELVSEYDNKKLFLTVNVRSFLNDIEAELFMDTVIKHGFNVIMVENCEHVLLRNEQRLVIDADLCEIEC